MTDAIDRGFEFDDIRVEPLKFKVWRGEEELVLEPKTLSVLIFLLENRGRLIEKVELLNAIWQDTFVTENAMAREIAKLRKVLGDDAKGGKYIQTVHTKGYRFVAAVSEVGGSDGGCISNVVKDIHENGNGSGKKGSVLRRNSRSRNMVAVAAAAAVLSLILVSVVFYRRAASTVGKYDSVAVLPFRVVGEGEGDYLADGVAEALTNRLTTIHNLRVIPWFTAQTFRGSSKTVQEIGREMNVATLLTGTLRRSGDRMSLSLQLIDVNGASAIWGDEFEENVSDILTVQKRLVLEVATTLKGRLNDQQTALLTPAVNSAEAYELCLRGNKNFNDRPIALELFRRAMALDPEMAEAYAGIGNVQYSQWYLGEKGGDKALLEAEENYRHALILKPDLYSARDGLIKVLWQKGKQEELLQIARELGSMDQGQPATLSLRAHAYYFAGLWDKAIPLFVLANEKNPAGADFLIIPSYIFSGDAASAVLVGEDLLKRSPNSRGELFLGQAYHEQGLTEQALSHYLKAVQMAPDDFAQLHFLGNIYRQTGNYPMATQTYKRAVDLITKSLQTSPDNTRVRMWLVILYADLGERDRFHGEEAKITSGTGSVSPRMGIARGYAAMGDLDKATQLFREAYDAGYRNFYPFRTLKSEGMEAIKTYPPFQELLSEWNQKMDQLRAVY